MAEQKEQLIVREKVKQKSKTESLDEVMEFYAHVVTKKRGKKKRKQQMLFPGLEVREERSGGGWWW